MFAKQYELARVDEAREGAIIQVLDFAEPPEHKSKPKKAFIAIIATFASAFVILLFVFLRQGLRKASQTNGVAYKLRTIRLSWLKAIGKR